MKKLVYLCVFIAASSYAYEHCMFGSPCSLPPSEEEISAVEKMFVKVRYALGGIYEIKISQILKKPSPEKNIEEYVRDTAQLKKDLLLLSSEAEQLNIQAYGGLLQVAINQMKLCLDTYLDSSFCSNALNTLKEYTWNKELGSHWSGYPVGKKWEGFPDSMILL